MVESLKLRPVVQKVGFCSTDTADIVFWVLCV